MTESLRRLSAEAGIKRAAQALIDGDLVAIPTETVYGLAADAGNPEAVNAVYRLKGRPAGHPLIVHVSSLEMALKWADLPASALRLAQAFWPGPLTLIARRRDDVPAYACGGHATVGLRVPVHPVAQAVLRQFEQLGGLGVAAPSANRFGRISPTRAEHVQSDFGKRSPLTLDGGPSQVGLESTIVDVSVEPAVILRPGGVSANELAGVLGFEPQPAAPSQAVTAAPGTLAAHYAPRTALRLCPAAELAAELTRLARAGQRAAVYSRALPAQQDPAGWIAMAPEAESLGQHLYDDLRRLDAMASDLILVELPPSDTAYAAVLDRLARAQTGSGQPSH